MVVKCVVCGRWQYNEVCDRCYAYYASQGIYDDEVIIRTFKAIDRRIEEDMRTINMAILEARSIS